MDYLVADLVLKNTQVLLIDIALFLLINSTILFDNKS